jgi:hypothetical protein
VAKLQQIGNKLASALAESILDNLNDFAGAHNVVCTVPVYIVKSLLVVFGGGVEDEMVLDEDSETMADMAGRQLTMLNQGGEGEATPGGESPEDLLRSRGLVWMDIICLRSDEAYGTKLSISVLYKQGAELGELLGGQSALGPGTKAPAISFTHMFMCLK